MRGLGTDHVIPGPMRGLEKNCIRWHKRTDRQTDRHRDSKTELAQWADSVKRFKAENTNHIQYKVKKKKKRKRKKEQINFKKY